MVALGAVRVLVKLRVVEVVLRSAFEWCVPEGGGAGGDEAMGEVGGAAGVSASAFEWREEPAWKVQRVA